MRILRHAIAIVVLPATVTVGIPWWVVRGSPGTSLVYARPSTWLVTSFGLACLAAGLALFVSSLRRFDVDGHGTLAPWDPPRRLVVRGPYAHVRNPMISGVAFVLLGEGLVLRSRPLLTWCLLFVLINAVYILLLEEPMLRARFGTEYEEYARHVPRLLPRLRPWTPTRDGGQL